MKKLFVSTIFGLFCIALVSCTQGGGSIAPSSATDISDETETASSDIPAASGAGDDAGLPDDADACTFWFAATDEAGKVMREIVDDYNAQYPETPIRLTLFPDESTLYDEIQAAVALNSEPDITVLNMDNTRELFERGLTQNINDVIKDETRLMNVLAAQGRTEDGTLFAPPFYGVTQVMFYNRDAFAQAGIDVSTINTWQDLANAAAKLKQRRICETGWELYWGYENMMDAVLGNGGTIFSEDGRTVAINTPEWVDVWEQFRIWIHEDGCMRVHTGGVGDEWLVFTRQDVQDGLAGGYTASSGDRGDMDTSDIGIFRQPAWQAGQLSCPGVRACLFNVFASAEGTHLEAAKAFVRYATDASAQIKWATGTGFVPSSTDIIKDDHYVNWLSRHPNADIPMRQCMNAVMYPEDPTGGEVKQIMVRAADRILIENIPAEQVLEDAQRDIQRLLDKAHTPPAEGEAEPDAYTDETAEDDTETEGTP